MNKYKTCIAILCWNDYRGRLKRTVDSFWKHNGHSWDADTIVWDNTDAGTGEDRGYIDGLPFQVFREGDGENIGVQDGTIKLWDICSSLGYEYILNLQDDFPSIAKTRVKRAISLLKSRPDIGCIKLNDKKDRKRNIATKEKIRKKFITHKSERFMISNLHFTLNPTIMRTDLANIMRGSKSEIVMMEKYNKKYKLRAQLVNPTFKTVIVKRRDGWRRRKKGE
jgi:hypothetical protein